jgi:hypothetical protein
MNVRQGTIGVSVSVEAPCARTAAGENASRR